MEKQKSAVSQALDQTVTVGAAFGFALSWIVAERVFTTTGFYRILK